MGMVLPGALIHSNYGSQVVEGMQSHFSHIQVILIQERLFKGVEEQSLLLLAEGAQTTCQEMRVASISESSQLDGAFPRILQRSKKIVRTDIDGGWLRGHVDEEALRIYDRAAGDENTYRLGERVTIRIGVVTGNNDFFTMTPQQVDMWKIPEKFLVPVVRSAKELNCLQYRQSDLDSDIETDVRGHLLLAIPSESDFLPEAVRKYLAHGEANGVDQATKCRERRPWYSLPTVSSPAAFMPCMTSKGHNLVVNATEATCTNNIFRLDLSNGNEAITMSAIAMGVLSTLAGLSAELVGRSYGGGVLKLEPSEMGQLLIPRIPKWEVQKNVAQIDKLLRSGRRSEATNIVDRIVSRLLNPDSNELGVLKYALLSLRSRRDGRNEMSHR